MGLVLRTRDPDANPTVELWLRAADHLSDANGHATFIPMEDVKAPGQLHPGARPVVDWRKVR